jgi:HTH-type transcriptional regulator, quorum sensing regulator NprR
LRLGKNYFNLSLIRQKIDEDLELARIYSRKALDIFKEFDFLDGICSSLANLSIQSHRNGFYQDSLQYLEELSTLSNRTGLSHYKPIIEYNYGRVYQLLGKYDRAIEYYLASIKTDTKLEKKKETIHALKGLIEINIELKNWNDVRFYLESALTLTEEYHSPYSHAELLRLKAQTFKIRFDFPAYEKELQQAVRLSQEANHSLLVKRISTELANHYNDVKAYKMAARYYKIALET